uniref:FAS1 domain-containing protein n=1 Tax=Nelumbo nucifera TaxID=4432 RepID=A0A822YY31_NELNU|nr:TPA_asm: hypothetical protein HUJ06_007052 [Nelumbo nucifera]
MPPSSTSVSAATESIRNRGYSLFAGAMDAAVDLDGWNGTGTIFAPLDFAFSRAAARFKSGRAPTLPTTSRLLYHTSRKILLFEDLTTWPVGKALPTFSPGRCIFIYKNPLGQLCIANKNIPAGDYVRIRQPNLYVDENLAIHGVDGILDPSLAPKCRTVHDADDPTARGDSFLDDAVRVLRRRNYGVVATSIALRLPELTKLTAFTVFAPRDKNLFTLADGSRYDFRHHVVPRLLRLSDLERLPDGTKLETLVPGTEIEVRFNNGVVTVNGAKVNSVEVYRSESVVVIGISRPMQINDGISLADSPQKSQYSGEFSDALSGPGVSPRTADPPDFSDPEYQNSVIDSDDIGLAPMSEERVTYGDGSPDSAEFVVHTTAPASLSEDLENLVEVLGDTPSPSTFVPVSYSKSQCTPALSPVKFNGIVSALWDGLGVGEYYCPINPRRDSGGSDVAPSNLQS